MLRREQPFVNILHATLRNYCVFNQRLTFYGQVTTFFETYRILLESEREKVVIAAVILCVYTLVACADALMPTNRRACLTLPDHLFTRQGDAFLNVGRGYCTNRDQYQMYTCVLQAQLHTHSANFE